MAGGLLLQFWNAVGFFGGALVRGVSELNLQPIFFIKKALVAVAAAIR